MIIKVNRKDLCTKRDVINMMRKNYLTENGTEFKKGYNQAIEELIDVLEKDL